MRISTRPAEKADIFEVARDLSRQTAVDMKALGLDATGAMGFFDARVPEDDAVAFVENGSVIGLCGWDKEPGVWYSWSMATARYYRDGDPRPVIASRRYLKRLQAANPTVQLRTIALVDHAMLRRWLATLGFYRMGPQAGPNTWRFAG